MYICHGDKCIFRYRLQMILISFVYRQKRITPPINRELLVTSKSHSITHTGYKISRLLFMMHLPEIKIFQNNKIGKSILTSTLLQIRFFIFCSQQNVSAQHKTYSIKYKPTTETTLKYLQKVKFLY